MHQHRLVALLAAVVVAFGLSRTAAGQLGSRPAEDWIKTLEAADRVGGLKVDEVVANLHLKPGEIVADIGAGPGLFEVPMARAVAPGGKIYAVEIDEGFFAEINKKANDARVTNVQTVLGKFTDPNLPTHDIDVAMFHDVLHHIQDRAGYLKALAGYMKRTGRIVLVDSEGGKVHPDNPEMQVSREQAGKLMADAGYKQVEDIKLFTDKYFLVYARR
jgi:ubiquinone/menaquinone biosynthesis C-methylase UbiE